MLKRTAECLLSFLDSTGHLDRFNDEFAPSKRVKLTYDKKKAQEEMNTFLWELEILQVDAQRMKLLIFTCEKELEAYAALHEDIDECIGKITNDIERLKGIVSNEKKIRQYKEEYENIAREINTFATPKQTAQVLESLEEQHKSSTEALQAINDQVELKKKELNLLLRAIYDLQAKDIHDDEIQQKEQDEEESNEYESKHTDEKTQKPSPEEEEEPNTTEEN